MVSDDVSSVSRADAIRQLTGARLAALQLWSLLQHATWADGSSAAAEEICRRVLRSIEEAISFLASENPNPRGPRAQHRINRGRIQERSHSIVTNMPHGDSEEWRMSGREVILNSIYARYYYKCNSRACPATKRVQQVDSGSPPNFLVTYISEHTCDNSTLPASSVDSAITCE
ncbi:Uncharacterized protein M6B38_216590 [Iris pallida]|uniref:WRKY domain-containing protein n=1 Tax=Iris pallida TaxID=29817 RepID=A0AAX6DZV0_IRIPA|nr:Uncharacterized protein M6B38_216590 [Iris pallida]